MTFVTKREGEVMKQKSAAMLIMVPLITAGFFLGSAQAKTKYLREGEINITMEEFNKALGVQCDFCHTKDRSQNYSDLAGQKVDKVQLSALVFKRIARAMLGTMLYINNTEGKKLTCITCHRGSAEVTVQ
jgi:hypothetical protein